MVILTYSTFCTLVTTVTRICLYFQHAHVYHCVPESFDNVGGDSGSAFMRVGLPGEGDSVFGHLCHYRLLRRPWKLDELRNSGHRRNSILCYRNRTKTALHANHGLILICSGCILSSDKEQHWQGAWFLAHRCLT